MSEIQKTNPVLMFLKRHGMEQSDLAEHAGLGYQTVHKTVMGMYANIPPTLLRTMARLQVDFMAREFVGYNKTIHNIQEWSARFNRDYHDWQETMLDILADDIIHGRLEASALFTQAESLPVEYPTFQKWRESLSYSQADFCKTFFIHQAILQAYEAGKTKSLPVVIKSRLRFFIKKKVSPALTPEYIRVLGELPHA